MAVALAWPYKSATVIVPKMWMLFAWVVIYAGKGIYLFWCLIGAIPHLWKGRHWHTGRYIGIPLAVITGLILLWGAFINRENIIINDVEITSERIPVSFDGYRIVQLSDLHLGTWGTDTTFVSALVDSVNALNPDLIVFTGDLVNRKSSEAEPFVKVLSRLHAPDGVVSVLGNHDYAMYFNWDSKADKEVDINHLAQLQNEMGWTLLRNQYMYINHGQGSIAIIGLENWGEPPYPSYGDIEKALQTPYDADANAIGEQWRLVLSHNPEYWDRKLSKAMYGDLTLSGHTHAMQMSVTINGKEYSPAALRYKQWGGLYLNENDHNFGELYVNTGAGTVGMPFRIGATPEITLFILHSQKQ